MGASVRYAYGGWYVFIRHRGERAAQKCVDEQHALDTQKAVLTAMTAGQFDIAALKKKPETPKEETIATVKEYYEHTFLPVYVESAVASSTRANYASNFKTHITPALGAIPLNKIGHDKMEEFVSDLVKKNLAKASIQTILKNLCTLFNHAKKRKVIVDNPAEGLTQLYSQATATEVFEPLTKKEVPLFLAAAKEHAPQYYAMFFTAIHTGVRQGELAGLQTGDMDFNGKYLVVQRSIDRIHKKVVPTKTKRIRRVDLSDELIGVLKEHIRQQKEYWLRQETKPDAEGKKEPKKQPEWLFPNQEGSWPDMANVAERHFHRCMEKAGLHRRRPYDMRHTFASLLLTAGAPIAYVSEQMGHQNIQLTVKLYGHLQPGANRHWMNKLPGAKKRSKTTASPRAWRVVASGAQKIKRPPATAATR